MKKISKMVLIIGSLMIFASASAFADTPALGQSVQLACPTGSGTQSKSLLDSKDIKAKKPVVASGSGS